MEIITTTEGRKVGDVVQVAKKLRDKKTGDDFWWRSFRVITSIEMGTHYAYTLILKLNPDMQKDHRLISFDSAEDQVMYSVAYEEWPQGVIAMHMKLMHQGYFTLE